MDGHREEMVRVEQAERRRDDAVPVNVGIVAPGDVETILQLDQAGHRIGAGAVHADLAVVVQRHEGKRRIDPRIYDLDIQAVFLGDWLPVRHRRAAKRIDADLQAGLADRFHVDHGAEIGDVGFNEILLHGRRRRQRLRVRYAPDAAVAIVHQRIGTLLDPAGGIGIGRAAVRRVVFDAAVARRIVRWRDDDAIGARRLLVAVMDQDGARNDRRRRVAVIALQPRLDPVGRQHFQRAALRRLRQGMGVLAEKQRPGDALSLAVFAHGLRDGEDVRLVEAAIEGAATMAAGAEGDALGRLADIGLIEIGGKQGGNIGQDIERCRLASERVGHFKSPGTANLFIVQFYVA